LLLMTTRQQPNILFLFPDQHRPDWLGTNPSLPLKTPNIDRLCERGMRFTRAYCPSPVCAPSRACLASGRDYDRCGVRSNADTYPVSQKTYYMALRDAGYRVAGVGKFDLDKPTQDWHLDGSRSIHAWGFTEGIDNEGKYDGSNSYLTNSEPVGPYLQFLHERGRAEAYCREHGPDFRGVTFGGYTTCLTDEEYCDNWLSENGLRFLRDFPSGQPWHLVVNFTGPHDPRDVTESMRQRWQDAPFPGPYAPDRAADLPGMTEADHLRNRQNYAAMIENIDRQVGRFIKLVKERGELDNTLIVYSSDHGEMLGDHGRWGKGVWHEPSVGVPLVVAGPGVQRGMVSDELVALHDLAPTFLECASAESLHDADARSLCPLLGGHTLSHRDHVLTGLGDWRAVIDAQFKLVVDGEGQAALFDLQNDPEELRDVAEMYPDQVARLSKLLPRRHDT